LFFGKRTAVRDPLKGLVVAQRHSMVAQP
jgi:hypothetical protein